MTRTVAITGLGVRAPGGGNVEQFWERMCSGRSATRTITHFDASAFRSTIAGECDFDPVREGLTPREVRRMDRATQLLVASAREAVAHSGLDLDRLDPARTAVSVGSACGQATNLEREFTVMSDSGRDWLLDARLAIPGLHAWMAPSSLATEVAWLVGAEGPASVISTGCTSGLDALGHAAGAIRRGRAEVVVAGGTDAPVIPISVAAFDAIHATSARTWDPAGASRPFDADRDGFVLAEGAAALVLEDLEHARRRGATVLGIVAGYATHGNAFHMTGLRDDGAELAHSVADTLRQAGIAAEQIGYVNAHGSGTTQNDIHETAAIKRSLGAHAYAVPVSSIKSMIGHSLGAVGAIEAVACVQSLVTQTVPPTANYESPDPSCDLDYVPGTAREARLGHVLSTASGFGGFQTAALFGRAA